MSAENEKEPLIIEIEDVDGVSVKVEIVGTFEDGGKKYVVANELEDDEASYLFEVQHIEEGDALISVDDEFNRLCEVLEELQE